jgi:nucleoside 2-deoxyribosyltransferase/ubiquinone/menaquinone biosynthesis C-methylase UbiE
MGISRARIYWANSLFTDADRAYNTQVVKKLRDAGFEVFLPQESKVNESPSPDSEEIFRIDSAAVLNSQLLIACLDQETIDSGVACEVGLAYAFNIPIIGLYTDIRQHRQGKARMYKNLYVLGAIEAHGEVVSSVDELITAIPKYLEPMSDLTRASVEQHYDDVAQVYSAFIKELESWYEPPLNWLSHIDKWLRVNKPSRILEFGCGPGRLGKYLRENNSEIDYLGFDSSGGMVAQAKQTSEDEPYYTSDVDRVLSEGRNKPFDLVVAAFTLHDHKDKLHTVEVLRDCIRVGGTILIIDLSTQDLSEIIRYLRNRLVLPCNVHDNRISPQWVLACSQQLGLEIVSYELALTHISFASFADLNRYFEMFGIYEGMDLPLGLQHRREIDWRVRVSEAFHEYSFPFRDQRVFVVCALKKK